MKHLEQSLVEYEKFMSEASALKYTFENQTKELMVAYSYLAYYYLIQFKKDTKDQQFKLKSIEYCNKVLTIQPPDPIYTEKAKGILKSLEPKIRKRE